jgi:para-aminobenzoate synthetase / 4-amino-4-deoxychorismate lyase
MDDRPPDLEATMAFDPLAGLVDLEDHIATIRAEATARGYPFDRHAVRNELQAATFRLRGASTVRLLVSPTGALAIEITPEDDQPRSQP